MYGIVFGLFYSMGMIGFDSVILGYAWHCRTCATCLVSVRDGIGSRYPLDAHLSAKTDIFAAVRRNLDSLKTLSFDFSPVAVAA